MKSRSCCPWELAAFEVACPQWPRSPQGSRLSLLGLRRWTTSSPRETAPGRLPNASPANTERPALARGSGARGRSTKPEAVSAVRPGMPALGVLQPWGCFVLHLGRVLVRVPLVTQPLPGAQAELVRAVLPAARVGGIATARLAEVGAQPDQVRDRLSASLPHHPRRPDRAGGGWHRPRKARARGRRLPTFTLDSTLGRRRYGPSRRPRRRRRRDQQQRGAPPGSRPRPSMARQRSSATIPADMNPGTTVTWSWHDDSVDHN